uniref:Phage integrase family protein n=1 Tax=Candidatus Kentrum sp. LFY TaxID=2126342 RepID=A0A450WJG5_9GAMM|nr:MAG: Phage integrase family protein [Candidatus Kentron sp. LFY]
MASLIATGIRVGKALEIELKEVNLKESATYIHGKGDRECVVFLPDRLITHPVRDYLNHRASLSPNPAKPEPKIFIYNSFRHSSSVIPAKAGIQ